MKQGTVEKIMSYSFYIEATATKRIQNILVAVLKLILSKMTFRLSFNLVTNLTPFGLCYWKSFFREGLINFKILFLKTL